MGRAGAGPNRSALIVSPGPSPGQPAPRPPAPPRPPARGGPCEREAGHPPGVALLYTARARLAEPRLPD
ncbi:MAG TPA: hypothetical protein VKV40_22595 [Ktedonobacteraceae bacterium]|nr:hypothetical protein [Ktedonobacteraceae bacterium]